MLFFPKWNWFNFCCFLSQQPAKFLRHPKSPCKKRWGEEGRAVTEVPIYWMHFGESQGSLRTRGKQIKCMGHEDGLMERWELLKPQLLSFQPHLNWTAQITATLPEVNAVILALTFSNPPEVWIRMHITFFLTIQRKKHSDSSSQMNSSSITDGHK